MLPEPITKPIVEPVSARARPVPSVCAMKREFGYALTNFVVEKYGWKKDYIGTGLIGVVFGLIGLTMKIPKRG